MLSLYWQSRNECVKCCADGELAHGRREIAVFVSHPAVAYMSLRFGRFVRLLKILMPRIFAAKGVFMLKERNQLRQLIFDAIMIAMYVVLNTIAEIPLGNIRITLGPLPVVFVAFYFGMSHSAVVAGVGEFISQMIGFGLTWTTPLWVVPPIARALSICIFLSVVLLRKKYPDITKVKYYEYFIIILLSGFITTVLNTAVIWLDAIIFNYYSYAYVFGNLIFRFVAMIISSVIYTIAAKAVIDAIYKIKS